MFHDFNVWVFISWLVLTLLFVSFRDIAVNIIYGCSAMILLLIGSALIYNVSLKPDLSNIANKYNIDVNKLSNTHYKIFINKKL